MGGVKMCAAKNFSNVAMAGEIFCILEKGGYIFI